MRVGNILNLKQQQNALVVDNPVMPKLPRQPGKPLERLSQLLNAELEAKANAKLLQTQPLIGKQATKATVLERMPTARIIHLATHGLLNEVQGAKSKLPLTPSGDDNGFLSAKEILNLQLQAELVILSACNTGKGEITGDGIIGLSRSFIAAGAPSIIVSLWTVPDAPTAKLMTEFYQQLQIQSDRSQVLRQAMLKIMKTHPEATDWAAFSLIGEAL
ncbi:High-affnity carbon uptake protein Hat/HatR [Richelia intracellularis]|nr:High-affnity carbon uptake protein Hat/HatR [Richelia intracellularis]